MSGTATAVLLLSDLTLGGGRAGNCTQSLAVLGGLVATRWVWLSSGEGAVAGAGAGVIGEGAAFNVAAAGARFRLGRGGK